MTSKTLKFTVDSHLLRELGERLVGRQYIALAELVKNSYDADATKVEIRFEDDSIEVSDNGHGMSFTDFEKRWMRIGSTHKVEKIKSPKLGRPLTGSKGVGRLAVQFLASELVMESALNGAPGVPSAESIRAEINWDIAVNTGDLTQAEAVCHLGQPAKNPFPLGKPHGTTVKLKGLKQKWEAQEFESLAREIWFLQPPFRFISGNSDTESGSFEVEFITDQVDTETVFNTQMGRIIDLYRSRIVGKLQPVEGPQKEHNERTVQMSLELEGRPPQAHTYRVPVKRDGPCLINDLEFEIRIFYLAGRQGYNIPVQVARDYMYDWGGVHIYDAGFKIPHAGGPQGDWLRLEVDHSHRKNRSDLLPDELQAPLGLNHLPTNSRVLGVVHIDTAREALAAHKKEPPAKEYLQIQVSRDRLVTNEAFEQLRDTVRYALDYYATRMKVKQLEEAEAGRNVETPGSLVQNVWDVLEQYESEMPKVAADHIRTELGKTMEAVREQSEWANRQSGLLGAMATIGATAMAFDHQFNQQLSVLEHHAASLEDAVKEAPEGKEAIGAVAVQIKQWIQNARATRTVFSSVSDERNRNAVERFRAKPVIETMAGNVRPLLRGVQIETSKVDPELVLPKTNYPVWMAIFHNLFMNASNAMLDSDTKRIAVSSFRSERHRGIWVQDTGVGIDLDKADDLFKPLQRDLEISPERRALGYGGTGLGLAIVRMLATDLKAEVRFIKPETPFKTCFEMAWTEES